MTVIYTKSNNLSKLSFLISVYGINGFSGLNFVRKKTSVQIINWPSLFLASTRKLTFENKWLAVIASKHGNWESVYATSDGNWESAYATIKRGHVLRNDGQNNYCILASDRKYHARQEN